MDPRRINPDGSKKLTKNQYPEMVQMRHFRNQTTGRLRAALFVGMKSQQQHKNLGRRAVLTERRREGLPTGNNFFKIKRI
jgi:hypothetical protein